MSAPRLALYSRRDCHLCADAHRLIERLRAEGAGFDLRIVDVDSDPELARLYGLEVPVLFVDGRKFAKVRVQEARLRRRLGLGAAPQA